MCVLPSGWALGLHVYKNALKTGNIKIDTLRRNDCFVKIVRVLHCFLDMLQN